MKLYITRHGTTEWNMIKRLQGWNDSKLTEEGVKRALSLGKRLNEVDFDVIYSSPQKRALDTAKLIRGNKDTKIITHEGLMELGFGIWEGMEINAIEKEYSETYSIYINNPELYVPLDGESLIDLFKRVGDFLDEILEASLENVLVVTHGVTIKAMLTIIKGLTLLEFSNIPVFTGTALNICEVRDNGIELILEGDTSHISTQTLDESKI